MLSCNGNSADQKKTDLELIQECEAKIAAGVNAGLDTDLANTTIKAYTDYAEKYPQDELSDDYYFNAGKICMSLNMGSKSVECYKKMKTQSKQKQHKLEL